MSIERFDRLIIRIALPLLVLAIVALTAAPFLYEHLRNTAPNDTQVITIYFNGRDNWSIERQAAWNVGIGTPDLREIRVKKGQKVVFRLMATDVHHGFALPGFGVEPRELKPGVLEEIEFIADKKGEFVFFCTIPCGSAHQNMTATLIVG